MNELNENIEQEVKNCIENFNNKTVATYSVKANNLTKPREVIKLVIAELKCSPVEFNRYIKFYCSESSNDYLLFNFVNHECFNANPDVRVKQSADCINYENGTKLVNELIEQNFPTASITSGGVSLSISKNEAIKFKHLFSQYNLVLSIGDTTATQNSCLR